MADYNLGTAHGRILIDLDDKGSAETVRAMRKIDAEAKATSFRMELFAHTMDYADKTVGRVARTVDTLTQPFHNLSGAGIRAYRVVAGVIDKMTLFAAAGHLLASAATGVAAVALVKLGAVTAGLGSAIVQLTGTAGLLPAVFLSAGLAAATLKVATSGLGDALSAAATGDVAKMNDAIKDMPPPMQEVVKSVGRMAPAFKALKLDVQTKFWQGMGTHVDTLGSRYLPIVQNAMGRVATGFNAGMKSAASFYEENSTVAEVNGMLNNCATAVNSVTTRLGSAARIFHVFAAVGSEFLPHLANMLGMSIDRMGAFVSSAEGINKIRGWMQGGITATGQLYNILRNVAYTVGAVFKIANANGQGFLQKLLDLTWQMRMFAQSADGAEAIGGIFNMLKAASDAFYPVIIALVKNIGTKIAPAFVQLAAIIGPKLVPFVDALGDAFARFLSSTPNIGQIFNDLMDAITPLLPVLGQVLADDVRFFANALKILMPVIQALVNVFTSLPVPVQSFLLTFGLLTPALFKVIFTITKFMTILSLLSALTGKSSLAMRLLGIAPGQAGKKFVFLRRVIATALKPISSLISLGARLAKVSWFTKSLSMLLRITGPLGRVAGAFTRFAGVARTLNIVTSAVKFMLNAMKLSSILNFFLHPISAIKTFVTAVVSGMKRAVVAVYQWIAAQVRAAASAVASAARATAAWVAAAARTVASWVAQAAAATANAVRIAAVWIAQTARTVAVTVANWVRMGAAAALQYGRIALLATMNAVRAAAIWIAQTAISVTLTIANWVRMAAAAAVNYARIAILATINAIRAGAIWVAQTTLAAVTAIANWVRMAIAAGINYLSIAASATANAIRSAAIWVAQTSMAAAVAIANWVRMAAGAAANYAAIAISASVNAIRTAAVWTIQTGIMAATAVANFVRMAVAAGVQYGIMAAQATARMAVIVATTVGGFVTMAAGAIGQAVVMGATVAAQFVMMAVTAVARMAVIVATTVTGWLVMAASSLAGAIAMAAAWFIALGPIGWVIAIVIALVALIIANWDTIKQWTITAFTAIRDFFVGIWNAIYAFVVNLVAQIVIWIVTQWVTLQAQWTAIWTGIWAFFSGIWNAIMNFVIGIIVSIVTWIVTKWLEAQAMTQAAFNAIRSAVQNAINTVLSIVLGIIGRIVGFFASSWASIQATVRGAWAGIQAAVSAGANAVAGFVASLVGRIKGFFAGAGQWLLDAGRAIMRGLLDGVIAAWNAVVNFLSGLAAKIKSLKGPEKKDAKLLIDEGMAIMNGLHEGMETRADGMLNWVAGMADKISGQINGRDLANRLGQLGQDAISKLAQGLGTSEDKVRAAIERIRETLQNVGNVDLSDIINRVRDAAGSAGVKLQPYVPGASGTGSTPTSRGPDYRPTPSPSSGGGSGTNGTPRPGDTYNLYTTVPQGSTVEELSKTLAFDLRHAGKGVYRGSNT